MVDSVKGLISVIVPVYKVEPYLVRCVESILAQSYKHLEIILVDDGSPDRSPVICDELARRDNRISVIHQENKGLSAARNAGLEIASGEYIGFVDSDDHIDEKMFETLLKAVEAEACDLAMCGFWFCFSHGESLRSCEESLQLLHNRDEAIINVFSGRYYAGHVWNKLFRRSTIRDLRFNPEVSVYEDMLFTLRALLRSESITFDSVPLYYYGIRDDSLFNEPFNVRQMTALASCEEMNLLLDSYKPELRRHAQANCLLYSLDLLNRLFRSTSDERHPNEQLIHAFIRKNLNVKSLAEIKGFKRKMAITIASIHVGFYHQLAALWRRVRRR